MDLDLLSSSYTVLRLNRSNVDACFELMRKNTLFYKYHPPFVTRENILEDMNALPPHKSYEDKYYLGFWEGGNLVAVIDFIMAYPTEETAWIGFFMTDVEYQNKGVGSKIIKELCARLKAVGYQKVRLGVDPGNPQSYAFWTKNQFCVIREEEYRIMELIL